LNTFGKLFESGTVGDRCAICRASYIAASTLKYEFLTCNAIDHTAIIRRLMTSPGFPFRILVVDDDPKLIQISAVVFEAAGYEVRTALDGFQALLKLRGSPPDLVVSDLRMPNMSGFEFLSVVRRRFPQIPVIAISGEFTVETPVGLIADAFFMKGHYQPEELFRKIAELIKQSPIRPQVVKPDRAPVWIPRSETGYFVVTCTDCLRSFSVSTEVLDEQSEVRIATCTFCGTTVQYLAGLQTLQKLKTRAS
jgi:CheY-like chemotaxis protein